MSGERKNRRRGASGEDFEKAGVGSSIVADRGLRGFDGDGDTVVGADAGNLDLHGAGRKVGGKVEEAGFGLAFEEGEGEIGVAGGVGDAGPFVFGQYIFK